MSLQQKGKYFPRHNREKFIYFYTAVLWVNYIFIISNALELKPVPIRIKNQKMYQLDDRHAAETKKK